jgi:Flp pilus assembly protein TadG
MRNLLRRFRRDEQGYMVVEATLILPFLLWGYIALYSYWDAYRVMTDVQKASYTISDLIARQQATINNNFINGMRLTMNSMLSVDEESAEVRVTSLTWSQTNNRFEVLWSRVSGTTAPVLTTAALSSLSDRIPNMSDGDTVVLVETWVHYSPAMKLGGIGDMTFQQFIVTRPRFAPSIVIQ